MTNKKVKKYICKGCKNTIPCKISIQSGYALNEGKCIIFSEIYTKECNYHPFFKRID